jgi:hypothetical protein
MMSKKPDFILIFIINGRYSFAEVRLPRVLREIAQVARADRGTGDAELGRSAQTTPEPLQNPKRYLPIRPQCPILQELQIDQPGQESGLR